MEKVKIYLIAGVAVLSALAVGAIVVNLLKDNGSEDLINNTAESQLQSGNQAPAVDSVTQTAVTIQNHTFSPSNITVKKGSTVTWTNRDVVGHDITPDNPSGSWQQSDLLGRGESYSVTFSETGKFTYHCSPHPEMTGSVTVVD